MFNSGKEEMIGVEGKKLETFKQHCEGVMDSFCPIIFVDEKEKFCDENALTTVPQKLVSINNIGACYTNNLASLPYNTLYAYQDSMNLAVNTIINRIKEESLMNTMSFMDTIEPLFNHIFMKYFNIREYIDVFIRDYNSIDDAVWNFINSRAYSLNKMDEDQIETTHKLVDFYSRHITTAVIYVILNAFNKGLDEVLFRVHLIPNIIELKRSIIKQYNVPEKDQPDERFWILANTTIKNSLNNLLTDLLFPVLMENTKTILTTSVGMSFYIYEDAIDKKSKEEYKRKADKLNKQNDGVDF